MARNKPEELDLSWAKIGRVFRSRAARKAKNNLGVIDLTGASKKTVYRSEKLAKLDAYYESKQYDHLKDWDKSCQEEGDYVAIRQRKPRIIYPFAKTFAERLTAKIVGSSVFPKFRVEDGPNDQELIATVVEESNLPFHLAEPIRRTVATGSSFVRFYIVDGRFKIEVYKTKFCYPKWKENGDLEEVKIQYVYSDPSELDENGDPKKKWYRIDIGENAEILYDNPEYNDEEPIEEVQFNEVSRVEHGMGFVQGQYFRTDESDDGTGFVSDILGFIDEFNYSLSQSSQAVGYNQDPQLILTGIEEEELQNLIRSSQKSWLLRKDSDGKFLESSLTGVDKAMTMRDRVRMDISDITRITLLDPEKIVGSAQSAKAMEILYGPLKDLVDELRTILGPQIRDLVLKMTMAVLHADSMGMETPVFIPHDYEVESMIVKVKWPPLFQQTLEDLEKKVRIATSAASGRLISERTATAFIAEDFGIEDIDLERELIAAQPPPFNPFGGF